jgi:hyperosmotically inducible periplasmic protein
MNHKILLLGSALLIAVPAFAADQAVSSTQNRYLLADNSAPDNTERNKTEGKPTAEDQANDKSDVRLTAHLRRAIMKQKGLSVDAQNIKIISENGQLFLRGPVKTEHEKEVIDRLAKDCCQKSSYKNELEVKAQ